MSQMHRVTVMFVSNSFLQILSLGLWDLLHSLLPLQKLRSLAKATGRDSAAAGVGMQTATSSNRRDRTCSKKINSFRLPNVCSKRCTC